jgi:hypothetical protein
MTRREAGSAPRTARVLHLQRKMPIPLESTCAAPPGRAARDLRVQIRPRVPSSPTSSRGTIIRITQMSYSKITRRRRDARLARTRRIPYPRNCGISRMPTCGSEAISKIPRARTDSTGKTTSKIRDTRSPPDWASNSTFTHPDPSSPIPARP